MNSLDDKHHHFRWQYSPTRTDSLPPLFARRHRPHYMTRPPATPYLTGLASADHNLGPGGDMRMRAAAAALHTLFNYDALNYYAKTRRERQREAGRGEGTKGGCAGLRA